MDTAIDFDRYKAHLSGALGHADRRAGLQGHCTGLMLPLQRKSVEPMAAGDIAAGTSVAVDHLALGQ